MNNLRNFEISVWTLQDQFITVLEDSYNKLKGKTQDAIMVLNIDGTQELTFSIPMKFNVGDHFVTNPAWNSTVNGNILINTRKIKVILDKRTNEEEIYEFVIDKITERHEEDQLYCDITCSGLAFYELGKIGYKIYLSSEDFYADDLSWFYKEKDENGNLKFYTQPVANIQYWLNKFLTPLQDEENFSNNTFESFKWYYTLQMDWDHYFNHPGVANDGSSFSRSRHKIYEDSLEYELRQTAIAEESFIDARVYERNEGYYKEKARMIDLEESNIYNLTQNIAEIFEVYCKYKYIYDKNYHIIGRVVIFYNSFLTDDNQLSITYQNQTSSIIREIDSTDLVTKMYVKTVDDNDDLISIIDVEDNPTGEDYILNFDYLYSIGTISQEQYNYITTFSTNIKNINLQLKPLSTKIANLEDKKIDVEARKATAETAVGLDEEQITAANLLLQSLTNNTGVLEVTTIKPEFAVLRKEDNSNTYYINLTTHGILAETVKIFLQLSSINLTPEFPVSARPEYDDFGNLIRLTNIVKPSNIQHNHAYLTYKYKPKLYYENIKRTWARRKMKDEVEARNARVELEELEDLISIEKIEQKRLLKQKEEELSNFEEMMGPAIREGYWQPENYSDSGDTYISNYTMTNFFNIEVGKSIYDYFIWDTDLIEGEQDIKYELGVEQESVYYNCINLSSIWEQIKSDINNYSFLFYDYNDTEIPHTIDNMKSFAIGSQALVRFINFQGTVFPALIIIGGENYSNETWDIIKRNCWIGKLKTSVNSEGQIDYYITNKTNINWITLDSNYSVCYPRIYIESLSLKNSEDQLALSLGDKKLENFNDYQIVTRMRPSRRDPSIDIIAYAITVKIEALYNNISFSSNTPHFVNKLSILFSLSNADSAIYNDALTISRESAIPQVSYEFGYNIFKNGCLKAPSKYLNHIVKVNDYELKFNGVRGYISGITLDLDRPWQDSLEIKNYRTKFEDLFSTILAQTEEMKKSEYIIENMSYAFDSRGQLQSGIVQKTLLGKDLNFAFNEGKLTIDENNGIWGISDSGVVAMRGGGIFTATQKDENDNWIWNTGILPEGINASLITTGQLDTNRIKIYAGDKLRLQMNENGLFAYKSFFEDFSALNSGNFDATHRRQIVNKINGRETTDGIYSNDMDPAQYVKFDENGLFLVAEDGALVLNSAGNDYITVNNKVDRVAISWDGLTLRNYNGEKTFYANADTGDLIVSGTIYANDGVFRGKIYAEEGVFSGAVTSNEGQIGPWRIAERAIYKSATEKESVNFDDSSIIYFGDLGLNFYNIFKIRINSNNTFNSFTINNSPSGDDYLLKFARASGDDDYELNIRRVTFSEELIEQIRRSNNENIRIFTTETGNYPRSTKYNNGDMWLQYTMESSSALSYVSRLGGAAYYGDLSTIGNATDYQKNITAYNVTCKYYNIYYNNSVFNTDKRYIGKSGTTLYGVFQYFLPAYSMNNRILKISFGIPKNVTTFEYSVIIAAPRNSSSLSPKDVNWKYNTGFLSIDKSNAVGEVYTQNISISTNGFASFLTNGFYIFVVPNGSLNKTTYLTNIEAYTRSTEATILSNATLSVYIEGNFYELSKVSNTGEEGSGGGIEPPIEEISIDLG